MLVEQPPLIPGAGPRPFRSRDDVIAHLDELLAGSGDLAPIRDALLDALTALLYQLQFRGEFAIAECDLLRATEGYLTSIGGDDRGVPRAPGEEQEAYRARLIATPNTVTEAAIILGVNVILAPFTSTQCQLFDAALDRWFVRSEGHEHATVGAPWCAFIGNSPEYPDRLYSGQEALNGGVSRPNSDPGGARMFKQTLGRQFILRLPDLSSFTEPPGVNRNPLGVALPPTTLGFFVGQTFTVDHVALVNKNSTTPLAVCQAIESFVNSVVGQSIRWGFFAELDAA